MNFKNKYLKYKAKYLNLKNNKMKGGGGKIYLVSKEGEEFEVDRNVAEMSNLVKPILPDDDDDEDFKMPLPNVSSSVLEKVIEFCNIHNIKGPMKEIKKPINFDNLEKIVDEWDVKFINNLELSMFRELIDAANYLEIKPLLDLLLVKVATILRGMTPEEIHKTFKVKNDFTPEEEAEVEVEGLWKPEDDIGMVEEISPEIAKLLKSKDPLDRISAAKKLLKILNDLKEDEAEDEDEKGGEDKAVDAEEKGGEAKKSKETLWIDVVSDLIVPYNIGEDGVIYRPEQIISWWRNTIFPFIGPSSLDRLKLRKLCRLFRDSLIPPMWAKFPHSKYSSLNKMMKDIENERWHICDSSENLSLWLSKSPRIHSVYAEWTNGNYYLAKITTNNNNGTYNIKLEDRRATLDNVPWNKIKIQDPSKVPSIIVISDGEHLINDDYEGCVNVKHSLTIVGESRDKTIIKGGFKLYSDKNKYQFKLENMTIANQKFHGLWAHQTGKYNYGSRFQAKNLTIRDSKWDGAFCTFPGTFIDCTIENCERSGISVIDTEINLKGENTLIARNGTSNINKDYGIRLEYDHKTKVNIYFPLTESVSRNNGADGNWGGSGYVILKNKEGDNFKKMYLYKNVFEVLVPYTE